MKVLLQYEADGQLGRKYRVIGFRSDMVPVVERRSAGTGKLEVRSAPGAARFYNEHNQALTANEAFLLVTGGCLDAPPHRDPSQGPHIIASRNGPSTRIHGSQQAALEEATRLAKANQGDVFRVCRITHELQVPKPEVVTVVF